MNTNLFTGPHALRDFLDPRNHPPTPLIELPASLNPLFASGVKIFAKRMDLLPLGNVKSIPAHTMLEEAQLEGVHTLVENSSGNTVFSLAILGRVFGVPVTKAIVSSTLSKGKLDMLRLFGTEVLLNEDPPSDDPNDPATGINRARRLGEQEGWWNPDQYHNEVNPKAHEQFTGPQIWEQLNKELTVFCAGLGTTGTLLGAGRYLKAQSAAVTTLGVIRESHSSVPGVRTEALLEQIGFLWKEMVDDTELVTTRDSYLYSLKLCREGILVGPSSGFSLAGLLQFLTKKKEANELDTLRNSNGEVIAAFICCDSPLPYLSEYFTYLDEENFPAIKTAESEL